jgi:sodium/pantothenate symporter
MNAQFLLLAEGGSQNSALFTFLIYTMAVFFLAALSNKLLQEKSFLTEYFLGSRSLGVWAFALTFAATSASGGSFTGFPSKIYTHGWVLALWIGSYMVFPLCTMGLMGKRLNQVARISGAITISDVIRDRFNSATIGLLATVLIIFFMAFNLIAQFKAGSFILKTLLHNVEMFSDLSLTVSTAVSDLSFLNGIDPEYLICLFTFGIAVIVYTTYGGFHAVVWTDVMQGIVMVFGVMIMLPLAISAAGGLQNANQKLANMVPPEMGTGMIKLEKPAEEPTLVKSLTWFVKKDENSDKLRLFRLTKPSNIAEGKTSPEEKTPLLEIITPEEITEIIQKEELSLEKQTFQIADIETEAFKYGANKKGVYVTAPGPDKNSVDGFLPVSLAFSFFFMWAISGSGHPGSMVRLMAFNNSKTLRRSILTVAIYFSFIYFPLVIIFCLARILLPGMDAESDRIMPAMAIFLTENIGQGWLAGLLIAAPFAAVMSTVDSYLLLISSAVVRDLYQRNINPDAPEKTIKRLSYLSTLFVGTIAMLGAMYPAQFLQDIIVYVGSGLAAAFLMPVIFSLYWPRFNVQGAFSGMLVGFLAHLSLYVSGIFINGNFFHPHKIMDFDPIIFGLLGSLVASVVVTMNTAPPPEELVRKYFEKKKKKQN